MPKTLVIYVYTQIYVKAILLPCTVVWEGTYRCLVGKNIHALARACVLTVYFGTVK